MSSTGTLSIDDAVNNLQNKYPDYSKDDLKSYYVKRVNYFKGSIAVCAIYGTIALILLLLILFNTSGSSLLTSQLKTFTLTFIAGMVVIIILIVINIVRFKPTKGNNSIYDGDMCPDYWQLVQSTTDDYPSDITSTNKYLMQFKCIPNQSVYDKSTVNTVASISNSANPKDPVSKLAGPTGYSAQMYGSNFSSKLDCSKTFPQFLRSKNATDTDLNDNLNALSCEYAKHCNIPWTSMGCPYVDPTNTVNTSISSNTPSASPPSSLTI